MVVTNLDRLDAIFSVEFGDSGDIQRLVSHRQSRGYQELSLESKTCFCLCGALAM